MTVASVQPPLALGTVAAARLDPALGALEVGAATVSAGLTQGDATQAAGPALQPGASPQLAASLIDALALRAAAQAVQSEGGLALLLADLSQALRIPALPEPVQAAISQILALRLPLDAPPTTADLKAALANPLPTNSLTEAPAAGASALPEALPDSAIALSSGGPLKSALLELQQALEVWLADEPALPAAPSGAAEGVPNTAPSSGASAPAVAAPVGALHRADVSPPAQPALSAAAPTSLVATAPATTAPASIVPALPATVLAPSQATGASPTAAPAVAAVLPEIAASATASAQASPAIEQAALPVRAGALADPLVLPASAPASAAPITVAVPPLVAPQNDEPALAALPQITPARAEVEAPVAQGLVAANTPAAATAIFQSGLAALPATVNPMEVMLIFQQALKAWLGGGSTQGSAAPAIAGSLQEAPAATAPPGNSSNPSNAPPPPYRGGPTTAQPAVPSTLPLNADPATIGNHLLRETGAAIAHQELLQIASLPAPTQGAAHGVDQTPQWMFEILFATAQGTAIAQFKISRDGGKGSNKGDKAPVWRALFSLDVEPMGPVHAQIVLSGDRTWVSLWAEREDSVARLRQHETLLTTSLKDSNFVPEIAFHAGAPRQPATRGAYFLNHAS